MANCAARIRTALDARRAPFQQGPVRDHAPALSRLVFGVVSLASRGAIRRDSAEAALAHKSHLLAGKHCCGIERDCTSLARPSEPEPSGAAQPSGARQLRETQRDSERRAAPIVRLSLCREGRCVRAAGAEGRRESMAARAHRGRGWTERRRGGRDGTGGKEGSITRPCRVMRDAPLPAVCVRFTQEALFLSLDPSLPLP